MNTYKLSDIGTLARGKSKHRPRDASHLYGGQYPFIQTGDVKNANHKIYTYTQNYSEAGLAQSKLWEAGTLCITIAANIADTAILTFPACFPDSVLGFVPDHEKCDVEYVEYMLQYYKKQIQQHSIGSVQENINLGTFQNITFQLPDLPTQRRIAEILSALDDKIELNRRMNQTLEQMAQTLFRQYFVDGIDEENLPEGWKVAKLEEIAQNFDSKRKPLSSRQREAMKGTYPYYGAASLMDFVNDYLFDGTYVLLGEDGTVVDKRGYPVLQYVWGKFWVNNHAHVLKGKSYISTNHLYMILQNTPVAHLVTGAVQAKINQTNLNNLEILVPDEATSKKFTKELEPLVEKIKSNKTQNEILIKTRDTLLPKLMSGEIDVMQTQAADMHEPILS